jgi:hypothetical protein
MNEPGAAVLLKATLFSLGCLLAWCVLLPLLVIGGGVALFGHAVFAEFAALFLGDTAKPIDTTVAREIARRMCGGARSTRRYPKPEDFSTLNAVTDPTSTSS